MLQGRGLILAPLDVPEDIDVAVRAHADGAVIVRRDLNDVVLEAEAAGVWIDALDFFRVGVPEGQERGFRAR